LPKPQLSTALAAEIRAAGVAPRSAMTSTSAASAASAWRRASAVMAGCDVAAVGSGTQAGDRPRVLLWEARLAVIGDF
jgi:hypothetical protein